MKREISALLSFVSSLDQKSFALQGRAKENVALHSSLSLRHRCRSRGSGNTISGQLQQLMLLKENCDPRNNQASTCTYCTLSDPRLCLDPSPDKSVGVVETTASAGPNTLLYPSKRMPLLSSRTRFTAHTLKIELNIHRT